MTLQLSRSAGGYNNPPDSQAEILREMARKRASDNTWNMVQSGLMAAQLAAQSAIYNEMQEVRRLNENTLAIQQELLNREKLQQYVEEFIFQTEKLVEEFSTKSDVPASTRYFLLQSVLAQVEQDGIDTATIRGRDNKAAFERAMSGVNQLVAKLVKDPEVQEAIKWAEEEEAKRAEKRRKIEPELNRLHEQRVSIQSQLNPVTFGIGARRWYALEMEKIPQQFRTPANIMFMVIAPMAVAMVVPAIVLGIVALNGIGQYRTKANAEANESIHYQLSTIDQRIAALESQLV